MVMLRQLSFCIERCPKLYHSIILPTHFYAIYCPQKSALVSTGTYHTAGRSWTVMG